jgi:hypothetical protein
MPRIRLQLDSLQVESFETRAAGGTRGGVMYADGPRADYQESGNDHCTGPTYVVVTCATCGEEYDTCFDTCAESCDYSCDYTCLGCWSNGAKPICLDG